jgi:hypothetical protein
MRTSANAKLHDVTMLRMARRVRVSAARVLNYRYPLGMQGGESPSGFHVGRLY